MKQKNTKHIYMQFQFLFSDPTETFYFDDQIYTNIRMDSKKSVLLLLWPKSMENNFANETVDDHFLHRYTKSRSHSRTIKKATWKNFSLNATNIMEDDRCYFVKFRKKVISYKLKYIRFDSTKNYIYMMSMYTKTAISEKFKYILKI